MFHPCIAFTLKKLWKIIADKHDIIQDKIFTAFSYDVKDKNEYVKWNDFFKMNNIFGMGKPDKDL